MSRDSHSGLECPYCRTHLALVPAPGVQAPGVQAPGVPAPGTPAAAGDPPPSVLVREEWTPPPVGEVLAQYADRTKDTATALRGAARVRDSLNRARQAAARRRIEQQAARSA